MAERWNYLITELRVSFGPVVRSSRVGTGHRRTTPLFCLGPKDDVPTSDSPSSEAQVGGRVSFESPVSLSVLTWFSRGGR